MSVADLTVISTLELLRRFWSGEPVNHHGSHYEVRNRSAPRPTRRRRA
ncbi:hypothetical protein ACIQ9Q_25710 [Streptomyces sp. NPDC094438]